MGHSLDLQYCSMLENSKIIKRRNRRVVNGLAVQQSWEWLVRLEFFTDDIDLASLCGGTVIHRYFILTAAHCCIGKDSVRMFFKEIWYRDILIFNQTITICYSAKIHLCSVIDHLNLNLYLTDRDPGSTESRSKWRQIFFRFSWFSNIRLTLLWPRLNDAGIYMRHFYPWNNYLDCRKLSIFEFNCMRMNFWYLSDK